MISNRAFNLFLVALPIVLLASCASEPTPTPTTQDKKAALCTDLARFNTAVATLRSMSANSTVGDFRKAQEQVKTTFATVKSSAKDVQNAKAEDLERAYQSLDKAIQGIPNTATLSQAKTSVAKEIASVQAAQNQMSSGLNCR